MRAAALAGVLTFGIFPDDDSVEIFGVRGGRGWGGDAAQDAGGANIGVVLEGLDEGKTEGPEGYVVWDV